MFRVSAGNIDSSEFDARSDVKERVMKKSDSFDDNESAAKLIFVAESYAKRRDWKGADDLFQQAISRDNSARARVAYGACLAQQERYFEAITIFTPILDGADRTAIGIACHNLASIYRDVGELDLARRFQWRAMLLNEDSGPDDLLGLANDAFASDRIEAAESRVISAMSMREDDGTGRQDGDFLATSGLIQSVVNSPEEALITLFSAFRLHRKDADFRAMGTDQLNMSILFGELKRYRAERSCLKRAIRYFEYAPAPGSLKRARLLLERLDRMHLIRTFNARRN